MLVAQSHGITRKKITKVFKRAVFKDREFFCKLMLDAYPLEFMVHLDETAKDRRTDHRRMARSVLGNRAYVRDHFERGKRFVAYDFCLMLTLDAVA